MAEVTESESNFTNTICLGDCLSIINSVPDNIFDLVYIDPPFFTRMSRTEVSGDGLELIKWEDWKGVAEKDIGKYVEYMSERVLAIKHKLKDSGTFWLHCDYRTNYKFRQVLEDIFEGNFVAEIIVRTTNSGKDQSLGIANQHETIFVFSKTKDFYLNNKYFTDEMPKQYKYKVKYGWWASGDLTQKGDGAPRNFDGKEIFPPKGKHWIWAQERINNAIANGKNGTPDITKDLIHYSSTGYPRVKKYWKNFRMATIGSIWDNCIKTPWRDDNINYPTKKSIDLMKRIVVAGCPEGGLVGDFFAGGGTTLLAAAIEKRKYFGCDLSPLSLKIQCRRFREAKLDSPHFLVGGLCKQEYMAMDKSKFLLHLSNLCGWKLFDKGYFDASARGASFKIIHNKDLVSEADVKNSIDRMRDEGIKECVVIGWDFDFDVKNFENADANITFKRLNHFLECFLLMGA